MDGHQPRQEQVQVGADAPAAAALPWRLRHPVLSRSLLYGLGVVVLAGLVVVWMNRRALDDADQHLALQKKLENLSIPLQQDPSGTVVLRALDEDYPLASLPVDLRALHHRVRALALASSGRLDEAIAAGAAAVTAETSGVGRDLARLEHARMLLRAERDDEATSVLGDPPSDSASELLVRALWAQAQATAAVRKDQREQARGLLQGAWDRLPEPLSASGELFFEGHDWTGPEVVFALARDLADLQAPEAAAATWRRLLRVAPGDARVAVEAAIGLDAAGAPADAEAALGQAREIDPVAGTAYLRALLMPMEADRAASLEALAQKARLPLKSGEPGTR